MILNKLRVADHGPPSAIGRNRKFESISLQERVHCELGPRGDETGRRVPPPAASPASLAECALRRQTPEVGAECPNWARSDLCGGRSAMGVPTANIEARPLM